MNKNKPCCPVEVTLNAIGGRWKILILRELLKGVKRFCQLYRALEGVTQKMLTQQLREMEKDGIIYRRVYPQVPPKVEYSISPFGKSLQPILKAMHAWGARRKTGGKRGQNYFLANQSQEFWDGNNVTRRVI